MHLISRKSLAAAIGFIAATIISGAGSTARAALITQTFPFTPQNIFTSSSGTSTQVLLTGTFNQFNPALGTLTGVTFSASFPWTYSITGSGSGGLGENGTFAANGSNVQVGGNTFALPVGSVYSGPTPASGANTLTTGGNITPDGALTTNASIYSGSGTFTFAYNSTASWGGGGPSGTPLATLSLSSPASETVNFTYTPAAVPEPASLSLLGFGALGLLRRRSRRVNMI